MMPSACGVRCAAVIVSDTPAGRPDCGPTSDDTRPSSSAGLLVMPDGTSTCSGVHDGGSGATGLVRHNDPGAPSSRTRKVIAEPAGSASSGKWNTVPARATVPAGACIPDEVHERSATTGPVKPPGSCTRVIALTFHSSGGGGGGSSGGSVHGRLVAAAAAICGWHTGGSAEAMDCASGMAAAASSSMVNASAIRRRREVEGTVGDMRAFLSSSRASFRTAVRSSAAVDITRPCTATARWRGPRARCRRCAPTPSTRGT